MDRAYTATLRGTESRVRYAHRSAQLSRTHPSIRLCVSSLTTLSVRHLHDLLSGTLEVLNQHARTAELRLLVEALRGGAGRRGLTASCEERESKRRVITLVRLNGRCVAVRGGEW